MTSFDTPVLLLIFNRPEHTRQVFEQIRAIKPRQLFVAADGPRENVPEDMENTKLAREVIRGVDWDCEVKTLFREKNLTSRYAVSQAITWFFEAVPEGIILEDDTLPHPSFFTFCSELLALYRDEAVVRHINGTNFLLGKKITGNESYYFSNYCHPWGWATWRRAWKDFDVNLNAFDESRLRARLQEISSNKAVVEMWVESMRAAETRRIDCWDYQWFYALWMKHGVAATSAVNLITNIGFGDNATNTTYTHTRIGNMKRMGHQELVHPKEISVNREADDYAMSVRLLEGSGTFMQRAKAKLKLILKSGKS